MGNGAPGMVVRRQRLAGQRAAVVMSLLQSAKLYGHAPWAYLRDVLTMLLSHMKAASRNCCHTAGNRNTESAARSRCRAKTLNINILKMMHSPLTVLLRLPDLGTTLGLLNLVGDTLAIGLDLAVELKVRSRT